MIARAGSGCGAPISGVMPTEPIPLRGLLLRRAVLAALLVADRPVSPGEVVAALRRQGVTTMPHLSKGSSRVIADLLAHQVRRGTVVKTGPALFAVVSDSMSRSTRWRCLHWQQQLRSSE